MRKKIKRTRDVPKNPQEFLRFPRVKRDHAWQLKALITLLFNYRKGLEFSKDNFFEDYLKEWDFYLFDYVWLDAITHGWIVPSPTTPGMFRLNFKETKKLEDQCK